VGDHLWPLLRLKGETEEEKKEAYSKVFVSTYVRDEDGEPIVLTDWNGRRVRFSKHNAEHVLSKDTDYRFRGGHHDKPFDPGRARRILWIKEVFHGVIIRLDFITNRNGYTF